MNRALADLLRQHGGVLPRRLAEHHLPGHVVAYAVRAGHVVVAFRGVLIDADAAEDPVTRFRAALLCAGPGAALSHTSALALWRLPTGSSADVHVTTNASRRIRVPNIVAHRRRDFRSEPPFVVIRSGLPVTRLEQSLVDSWPLDKGDLQRAPLILAVAERLTTPARVRETLHDAGTHLGGRTALCALLLRLEAGCRSELELWGYDHVLTGPGMPPFARQFPVRLGHRTVYLDLLHGQTRTNFELDGARWHASPAQREVDLRRDATLATLGYQVVRFTHDRLTREPDEVRREVLTIIASRSKIIGH